MKVRITPTIANEYESRCPDHIPDRLCRPGTYDLSPEEAETVKLDAAHNSDPTAVDVGQFGVPLPVFNAYRALLRQFDKR